MIDDERPREPVDEGAPLWMTTFGDLMSLLLTFFILLYSMSELKQEKFLLASQSLREAFGGTAPEVPLDPASLIDEELIPDHYLLPGQVGLEDVATFESVVDTYMEVIARRLERFISENGLEREFTVERAPDGVYLRMQSSALFASGSAFLEPRAVRTLGVLSEITRTIDVAAVVSGHADDQPITTDRFASNWELSAARAAGVARHLVEAGQPPRQLRVESFGEHRPLSSNATDEGRARNRRVDIFFARADILEAVRRWARAGSGVPELDGEG